MLSGSSKARRSSGLASISALVCGLACSKDCIICGLLSMACTMGLSIISCIMAGLDISASVAAIIGSGAPPAPGAPAPAIRMPARAAGRPPLPVPKPPMPGKPPLPNKPAVGAAAAAGADAGAGAGAALLDFTMCTVCPSSKPAKRRNVTHHQQYSDTYYANGSASHADPSSHTRGWLDYTWRQVCIREEVTRHN